MIPIGLLWYYFPRWWRLRHHSGSGFLRIWVDIRWYGLRLIKCLVLWSIKRTRVVVPHLRQLRFLVLQRNTYLNVILISLIVRCHVIHQIVLLHENTSHQPHLVQSNRRTKDRDVTAILTGPKLLTIDAKLVLIGIYNHGADVIEDLHFERFSFLLGSCTRRIPITDVKAVAAQNIVVVFGHYFFKFCPVFIREIQIWQVRV